MLKYFAENWTEVKTNKCNDVVMNFFIEFNRHRNLFTLSTYNDQNFEFLLKESIKEILKITQTERNAYNSWSNSFGELKSERNDWYEGQNLKTF